MWVYVILWFQYTFHLSFSVFKRETVLITSGQIPGVLTLCGYLDRSDYYSTSLTQEVHSSWFTLPSTALSHSFWKINLSFCNVEGQHRTRGQERFLSIQFSSLNHINNGDLKAEFLNICHICFYPFLFIRLPMRNFPYFISTNNYWVLIIMHDTVLSVRSTKISMMWSFILQNFQRAA